MHLKTGFDSVGQRLRNHDLDMCMTLGSLVTRSVSSLYGYKSLSDIFL
jgi:hypothetical protein